VIPSFGLAATMSASRSDLKLLIAIEDRVAGVRVDEVAVDQLETVGDLICAIQDMHGGVLDALRIGATKVET
jgi:hypothetical protein